jgi:hypothetical protein
MYDSLHVEGEATIVRELHVALWSTRLQIPIAECATKLATGKLDRRSQSLNGRYTTILLTRDGSSYQMLTLCYWKCDRLATR